MTLTREDVSRNLIELPALLEQAEFALIAAEEIRDRRTRELQEREDELTLAGLNGRNEGQRLAELRSATREEREVLAEAERQFKAARLAFRRAEHQFTAARALARLLAGTEV